MMTQTGIRLRRRIDPAPDLRAWLDNQGLIEEIADKSGRVWTYFDDSVPIGEWDITEEIVRKSTLLFVILDPNNNILYTNTAADKAAKAFAGATVTFHTDAIVDDLPEAEEVEQPDLPKAQRR